MKKIIGFASKLIGNAGKGVPLVASVTALVKEIKEKKAVNVEKLLWFAVEFIAVIGVLWAMKHFGVTIEQITSLFDLF